jgi:hypothetical protein
MQKSDKGRDLLHFEHLFNSGEGVKLISGTGRGCSALASRMCLNIVVKSLVSISDFILLATALRT